MDSNKPHADTIGDAITVPLLFPPPQRKSNRKSEHFARGGHTHIQRAMIRPAGVGHRLPLSESIAMSVSIEHPHLEVDVDHAGGIIRELHDRVCAGRQRIHITRADCDDTCIMVSRTELESFERALAIFADTREFSEMCRMLSKILETAGEVYAPRSS